MADSFDVIVIGGGPGGYVAAIRAAQLGQENRRGRARQGGRSLPQLRLHPAKTILRTAEIYTEARESADLGVVAKDVSLDWDAVHARRAAVSESLSGGVKMLWDKNKVTVIEGEGSLTAEGNVKVGEETYEAGAVILATGSVASPIPGVEFGERIVDTWGAWSLPQVPKRIAVVGAGASGCEIASAYGRFGTEVLLMEMLPQILPAEDKDVVRVVERAFKKQNITVATGNPVENVEAGARARSSSATAASRPRSTTSASPAAAAPTPRAWAWPRPGSSWRRTARSRSTRCSGRRTPRSTRSATWSTPRRSPTRPPRRASSRPRPRPGSRPTGSTRS